MIPADLAGALAVLDRRLDSDSGAPVAVALSGGSDSLALMLLVRAWTRRVHRPLLVLTVDHQLHVDSPRWTAAAGEMAQRLGADWRGLTWAGAKPQAGLPAAARKARHALLADAARSAGAQVLVFGHTTDDVAESALIRAHTATHGRLAEWTPSPAWPQGRGVFLLRPLLDVRRARLQAWLTDQGLNWLDDPANADPRYARTRARSALAQACARLPAASPSIDAGRPRFGWSVDVAGGVTLSLAELGSGFADLLGKALLCASGEVRPPRASALTRLTAQLTVETPSTLAGARATACEGRVRLTREPGRHPPAPRPLTGHASETFDGRFTLEAHEEGWSVTALAGHAAALPRSEREALHELPADVRPALPVLLAPGGEPRLPQPFGSGPAQARSLVAERLAAAWGLITDERALELSAPATAPVAPAPRSSYLDVESVSLRPATVKRSRATLGPGSGP